ncbi:MAG: ABC transporter permease [Anaerolineaceae bacterium]|jgi:simple sugar transport system permease protein|nr:ABC transporter permease [Anaerolineaceae bacterium]
MDFDISRIITLSLFAATLRMTTPILFATLGGIFSSHTGIFHVGLEGLLDIAAFFAVVGSVKTGSPWGGLLYAIVACLVASLVFAFVHLELKANEIIVGLALNIFAGGLTNFLLVAMLDSTGFYQSPLIKGFSQVDVPVLKDIPVMNELLSGHFPLVYFSFLFVLIVYILLYRTPFGFHLRAVGEKTAAAEAVGINPKKIRYIGLMICGTLCGLGGTFLSLSYLNMFSEGISAGRGWVALAAINFGEMKPLRSLVACLIFGFADALALRLQQFGLPSQVVLMLPYASTLIVLIASAISREAKKNAAAKQTKIGGAAEAGA